MGNNSYFSPAKINLFFRIIRKRSDGYHEIASLYQAIDLFDRLTFSKSSKDALFANDSQLLCDDTNLVHRALQTFRSYYSVPPVRIHLEKKIPMQSGLGGGSSNAATALFALNEIIGRRASMKELMEMGAQIGSDVSFFFSSGTAFCTGRGEIITPHPPIGLNGRLAIPPYGLSTVAVYRETRVDELERIDPQDLLGEIYSLAGKIKNSSKTSPFVNDLEKAAFRLLPKLRDFRDSLKFPIVSMTGSGSAFFCLGNPSTERTPDDSFIPFRSVQRRELEWYQPEEMHSRS